MPFRIIYLDDEPDLLEMFKDNFESVGVSIQTFSDPETAIKEITQNPPNLVFLDFRLPNTTGEKVAERLPPSIPKILVTGDLAIKSTNIFVKIFHKPFNFEEMELFIKSYSMKQKAV